jgi:hypothetical protein
LKDSRDRRSRHPDHGSFLSRNESILPSSDSGDG